MGPPGRACALNAFPSLDEYKVPNRALLAVF